MDAELIQSEAEFRVARQDAITVLDLNARLPEYVFARAFAKYYVFPSSNVETRAFPDFLHSVAIYFSEDRIRYMSLEPDSTYYRSNCGFFAVAQFEVGTVRERYFPVMAREGAADSFMVRGGDVAAIWGTSGEWCLHCDRRYWELGVLGSTKEIANLIHVYLDVMSWEQTQEYLREQHQGKPIKVQQFLERFSANYPLVAANEKKRPTFP